MSKLTNKFHSLLRSLGGAPTEEPARYVLTFIVGAVIGVVAQRLIENKLKESWDVYALVLVMICLLALAAMLKGLTKGVSEIGGRIGLSVRYVEREGSRAMLFRELRSIIRQARKRIIIVNTDMMHTTDEDDDSETINERRLYFGALLDKVRKEGVFYHRVIQAEEGKALKELRRDRLRHFHEMLETKIKHGSLIGLTRAADTRPLTFTLVDDRWLMLEVDQRDAKGLHMEGILIFDDPQRTVFRDFERFYQSLALSPKNSIEKNDLPEPTQGSDGLP
jgi:hypothetical protein